MLSGLQSSVLLIVPIWGNDITALTNTKKNQNQNQKQKNRKQKTNQPTKQTKPKTNKQNKTKHLGTQIQHPCPP